MPCAASRALSALPCGNGGKHPVEMHKSEMHKTLLTFTFLLPEVSFIRLFLVPLEREKSFYCTIHTRAHLVDWPRLMDSMSHHHWRRAAFFLLRTTQIPRHFFSLKSDTLYTVLSNISSKNTKSAHVITHDSKNRTKLRLFALKPHLLLAHLGRRGIVLKNK